MPERTPETLDQALNVTCPRWLGVRGLSHGVTTRVALPEPGKLDLFAAVTRAREAGALPVAPTLGGDQVHGTTIRVVDQPIEACHEREGFRHDERLAICEFPATDALITTLPGVLLVIQTADCLPVFIIDEAERVAGLAHCGWRGTLGGLAGSLAARMIELGSDPAALSAWLAPCICARSYEVSAELVGKFREAFPGAEVSPDGRHLDLPAIARWQLRRAGLADARILASGECTFERPERYHSYRAQGDQAGRMLSFVGFDLNAE